jgi:hypothetical protein
MVWRFLEHHKSEGMYQEREEENQEPKQFEIKPKPRCNLIKAKGDNMHECNMMT